MNEAFRVLAPGGIVDILVPTTDGRGAWCDRTHVSFWNIRSFRYYTELEMRQYVEAECRCLFRIRMLQDRMLWEGMTWPAERFNAQPDSSSTVFAIRRARVSSALAPLIAST
jgi:hypothetical protein